jgi:hypothetical protein
MRRSLTALLMFLLLVPDLPARTNRDWENVKNLKPGTPVQVLLWSGEKLWGEVDAVSDAGLRVIMVHRTRLGPLRELDRGTIRRIASFRKSHLPDPGRWMLTGALAGGAIGVAGGAIGDANQHTQGGWLFGGLAGAFGGAMVGGMAAGFVVIGKATPALLHHSKIVYEDAGPRPLHSQ